MYWIYRLDEVVGNHHRMFCDKTYIWNEWIIEEEKSTFFYPFLKDLDYIDLISRYDNAKIGLDKDKREIVLNMYKISSSLVEKLKNTKFKVRKK